MPAPTLPVLAAFDMAGTTVDDHGLVYVALQEAVQHHGVEVADSDLQTFMGAEKRYAIRELAAAGGLTLSEDDLDKSYEDFTTRLRKSYAAQPPVGLPGVGEAIDALRAAGIKVALTTGFAADVGEPLVDALGWWDRLDAVICASGVPQGRPAPYMIFRAMEATGTLDVATVMVAGDTVVDLQAAANAGAGWRLGVLTGALDRAGMDGHGATDILDGVADIPQWLGLT